MSEALYTSVNRIVWRKHAKGPGVATFEYIDGGHDHRKMSQYEARNLAGRLGLAVLQERHDVEEWIRP
jgi:hypothetical protein